MSTIMDGIIQSVSPSAIVVVTELGEVLTLPRSVGETPPSGTAVRIDFSTGSPKMYSTPPITEIGKVDRYMNFYALPENPAPEVEVKITPVSMGSKTSTYGPFTPFGFVDTPIGARTIMANNGNVCFSGPTAVGMAVSCNTKIIAKQSGQIEFVTPHFTALQGRTVVVSNFKSNISIEIDIVNAESKSKVSFEEIKKSIIEDMLGAEAGKDENTGAPTPAINPKTYEKSFEERVKDFQHEAFASMFGLHLAEILTKVQWERVRFRGDEKTFNEVFSGIADFNSYQGYCNECYENGDIVEIEFFLVPGDVQNDGASIRTPQCEEQVATEIYDVVATINEEQYAVTAMNINMRSGTRIEYVAKKRVYSFSHGVIAKKSFVSADQQLVMSNSLHVDVDKISFSQLSFDNGVPDFCDNNTNLPSIYWNGDFLLSVSGSLAMASVGNLSLASSVQSIIAGGTRGIKIDSSGSTAITF